MKTKGFLGPIGDDLPSLIPLLFALLIFFGTFSFSYSVFSRKNADFARDIDVLNISKVLKGTNYILSAKSFSDSCRSLNPTSLNYRAFVTNFYTAPEVYCTQGHPCPVSLCSSAAFTCNNASLSDLRVFDLEPFELQGALGAQVLLCEKGEFPGDSSEFFTNNPYISRIYPLVVEDDKIVKPMHMVVVAWKE